MRIKKTSDSMTPSLDKIQRDLLRQVPREAHNFFVKGTPKRTGNARNKTKLQGNVINAGYAYADRLDKGYSRQAPKGMTAPTTSFITRLLRRIIRK
jgi:hypothetical protein